MGSVIFKECRSTRPIHNDGPLGKQLLILFIYKSYVALFDCCSKLYMCTDQIIEVEGLHILSHL